jgi:partner of Y14 and mago protein
MSPSSGYELKKTTKAGITITSDGERVIPASVRPDGSTRPERRVRPGYSPPEDVEVYKNRSVKAWQNRGSDGIPGATPAEPPDPPRKSDKNAKRRAARKKAKEMGEAEDPVAAKSVRVSMPAQASSENVPASASTVFTEQTGATASIQSLENREKQAKAIRKKIRQVYELKSKKDGGENLLPEQLEKVIKLDELLKQLSALGLDEK